MIYQTNYKSPVGSLLLTSNGEQLTGLSFSSKEIDTSDTLSVFDQTCTQLDEYFNGNRKDFSLPLLNEGTAFQQKVWKELLKIPYGSTISYKELSIRLGALKAIRAVGTANGKNNLSIIYPCHRVIGSDGSLTGYAWGVDKKKWLLKHENHPLFASEQMGIF